MASFFKNLKRDAILGWDALFHGMAGGNDTLIAANNSSEGTEAVKTLRAGGVLQDIMENKQTQQVKEFVDTHYRVVKESNKWNASNITPIFNADGEVDGFGNLDTVRKKTKADFMKHSPVFEQGDYVLRTIQVNKNFPKRNFFTLETEEEIREATTQNSIEYTIMISRDYLPSFKLEQYATRAVVRNYPDNKRALVDIYVQGEATPFDWKSTVFVGRIHEIEENKYANTDITDIKGIEWVSEKAWNTDDLCRFKYDDVKFVGVNRFDGSFILTFDCNIVEDGKYLPEKFKTKEMDEKYATKAPKKDVTDIFAINRQMNKDAKKSETPIDLMSLEKTTLKITD